MVARTKGYLENVMAALKAEQCVVVSTTAENVLVLAEISIKTRSMGYVINSVPKICPSICRVCPISVILVAT
jgi:hypothetical protein